MNQYFFTVIADLDLIKDNKTLSDIPTSLDGILERFHCRQSILKIRKAFKGALSSLRKFLVSENPIKTKLCFQN